MAEQQVPITPPRKSALLSTIGPIMAFPRLKLCVGHFESSVSRKHARGDLSSAESLSCRKALIVRSWISRVADGPLYGRDRKARSLRELFLFSLAGTGGGGEGRIFARGPRGPFMRKRTMFEGVSTRNKYGTVFIRLPLVPRKLAPCALYSSGESDVLHPLSRYG